MKIAYLVFAYRNPHLINKMIEHLSCKDSSFYIHIDKKSNIDEFSSIKGKNIHFSDIRLPVYWAEYSGIRAILILMHQAINARQDFDYFVLLSGSDYPIQNRQYIHDFFKANRGMEFMNIVRMPCVEAGKPLSRINTLRFESDRPIRRFIVRLLARLSFAQRDYRKYLGSLHPYSGNTWWALTRDSCRYILEFVERNQNIAEYFKCTFAPEEMFFQTIIGNSQFRSKVRRNLVYEDWSAGGGHPAMIGDKHLGFFEADYKVILNDVYGSGEVLFARKLSDDNIETVQRIDEMIKRKNAKVVNS
jgi:hypothetical protein